MLHTGPDTKAQKAWGNSKPKSSHETNLVQFGGSSNTTGIGTVFGVSGRRERGKYLGMNLCEKCLDENSQLKLKTQSFDFVPTRIVWGGVVVVFKY